LKEKVKHAKLELKKSKRKDYYKILSVPKEVTEDETKKAYKKAALRWHPDKHSNGTEEQRLEADKMFKDISEAYTVLSDPKKKNRYDQGADIEDLDNDHSGHGFGGGGMDPNDIFRMFFAQGGGGMGGGGHQGHSHARGGGGCGRGGGTYTYTF
jgi:DnaJ family protein C protein 7